MLAGVFAFGTGYFATQGCPKTAAAWIKRHLTYSLAASITAIATARKRRRRSSWRGSNSAWTGLRRLATDTLAFTMSVGCPIIAVNTLTGFATSIKRSGKRPTDWPTVDCRNHRYEAGTSAGRGCGTRGGKPKVFGAFRVNTLLSLLFPCSHSRTTFPMSRRKHHPTSTYVVCLDCGKEFGYDWTEMKMGREIKTEPASANARRLHAES